MPTIRERNGAFNVQVRIKRDGVIVHQESATFATYPQALEWGRAMERKLKDTPATKAGVTVADLMDKYEAQALLLGRHSEGRANGAGAINGVRQGSLAKKQVTKVTTSDITSWATLKRYTHLKPQDVLDKLNARSKRPQETLTEP